MGKDERTISAVVDRIEKDQAALEIEGRLYTWFPLELLPEGIKEGAALKMSLRIDKEDEERRKKRIEKLQDEMP